MKALHILAAAIGILLPSFAMAQVSLQTLRACLEIEDQSKERLDCYDAKIAPEPKPVSAPAKTVEDCRFVKEQDERLNCFNRFVNVPSRKSTAVMAPASLQALQTCLQIEDQSKERLDCYDAKIAPEPRQVSAPSKTVKDCRFVKEQDERLNCFNRFVNTLSKKNTAQRKRKRPQG